MSLLARLFSCFLLSAVSLNSFALESITLVKYLKLAESYGFNLLYSSNLVSPQFKVIFDPDKEITVKKLRKALAAFDLKLNKIDKQNYSIIRTNLETVDTTTNGGEEQFVDLSLGIEELVVTASQYRLQLHSIHNKTTLAGSEIRARPVIANDATRLVNQLPGSANSGISGRPNVRGGNEDETLIIFDGVSLYEPFHFNHFNNLISSFDSRIISSLDFHSGGFNVEYGDRLSAAMAINTKDNAELLGTRELGLGLFNLSYLQAGGDSQQSWLINVRRSTVELLTGLAESDLGTPSFADFFGRFEKETDMFGDLSINLFWFGDEIELKNGAGTEEAKNLYGNTYLWLSSKRYIGDNLFLDSKISVAAIKNDRKGLINKTDFAVGSLNDDREFRIYGLKQDYEYFSDTKVDKNWKLDFGWHYQYLVSEYVYEATLELDPVFQNISNFDRPSQQNIELTETGHQLALYSSLKWFVTKRLSSEIGLRLDAQHYERSTKDEQFSPRINFLYAFNPDTKMRFGWGKFSQAEGIHELKISDGLGDFQQAQKAEHLIFGFDQRVGDNFSYRIEAYKKTSTQTNTYFQNLTTPLSLVPELQPDRFQISPEQFEARGIEFSFSGLLGKYELWGNYGYSTTEDRVTARTVKRSWDQAHAANIGLSTSYRGWLIAFSGSFHEGWLTTPLDLEDGVIQIGPRNSQRFNDYASLDLKVTKAWTLDKHEFRLEAGITNLLDRKNQVGIDYDVEDGELEASSKFGIPLAPFLDFYWKF